MQAQFEDIFKHIAAAEGAGDAPPPPAAASASAGPAPSAPPAEDASFQETIRRTMERMQASGDQATAAAAEGPADDFMSEMLKQLSSGDLGALGGDGSEEEFSKMLMGMMEQLTNKEILYEPMKELDDKFPEWLAKNRNSTPKEDLKRYEEQQSVVREIVAKFEEKTYSDSNSADREFIVDRMQKVCVFSCLFFVTLVTDCLPRCKQRDRLPLTWLETWHPRRKLSTPRMKHVILSRYRTWTFPPSHLYTLSRTVAVHAQCYVTSIAQTPCQGSPYSPNSKMKSNCNPHKTDKDSRSLHLGIPRFVYLV